MKEKQISNQTKLVVKLFMVLSIAFLGYLLLAAMHTSIAYAAYALPYGAGATPQLGISGLHGGNFSYMQDDNGTSYYLGNTAETDESLDIGYEVSSGGNAPTQATALGTGTVIAHNTTCHQIIVSYNNGSIWAMYIKLLSQ